MAYFPEKLTVTDTVTLQGSVLMTDTGAVLVPVGTTGERPAPSDGMFRYNTTLKLFEGRINGAWGAVAGRDIIEFTGANNQSAAIDVTNLYLDPALVRSFVAEVQVVIDATAKLYETFTLKGIQRESDFVMTSISVGDNSGVNFTITSLGQVQYTSGNSSGFVSLTMKFYSSIMP